MEEATDYCTKQKGYLAEYELIDEFEIVRSTIVESLGSYWFWVGASSNQNPDRNVYDTRIFVI